MLRNILGFAVVAIVAWITLKLFFGILGTLIGLAITVLVLAAMGYVMYLVLRLFSPSAATKVREAVTGRTTRAA